VAVALRVHRKAQHVGDRQALGTCSGALAAHAAIRGA
jgi:hypothetical protein